MKIQEAYVVCVSRQRCQGLPGVQIPELHGAVIRACRKDRLRRMDADRAHRRAVSEEAVHLRPHHVVPELNEPVMHCQDHPGPRRVEAHSLHACSLQRQQQLWHEGMK